MEYEIDARYVWYNEGSQVVLMYFIQGVPFSFDEVEGWLLDPTLIELADKQKRYSIQEVYDGSSYLIEEECHPLIYDLNLKNPEIMPNE